MTKQRLFDPKCMILLLIVLPLVLGTNVPVIAAQRSGSSSHEKGLMLEADVILGTAPSSVDPPSLAELKRGGFTLVGTALYPGLSSNDMAALARWLAAAHKGGFKTMLQIGWRLNSTTAAKSATAFAKYAASVRVDLVELDELLYNYQLTKNQLSSIIDAGLSVNPHLLFVITEYAPDQLQTAYVWTSSYPMVRVASDNYNNKSIIDLNMNLAQRYNKQALAWLIFSKEGNFDSYNNMKDWLQYTKQKGISVLFYEVDGWGTWQRHWEVVQSYTVA